MAFWKKKETGVLAKAFKNDRELQKFVLNGVTLDSSCTVLGTGSYGKVEEVKYRRLTCAGKSMHECLVDPGNEGVAKIVHKYLQECQLMSSLRHPNITQFLGLCFLPESQLPMIVMERLETSLDDLLELIPNIPLSTKRKLLEDVASGLLYLHELDPPVIHRDLTSRNILLTSSLVAKIADMGNSRIVDLKSGKMIQTLSKLPGTLVYMPPEALEDKSSYDSSLDVFSFGHLALYTVTQRFPGDLLPSTYPNPDKGKGVLGRTELERREVYITFLEDQIGQVYPRLVELIKSCLENNPAERPSTAELLSMLQDTKVEVEGDHGALFQLDMTKVRLAQEHKAKQHKMKELTQQMDKLTEECTIKDQRIEELVQQRTAGESLVEEIKMKDERINELLQQQNKQDAELQALTQELEDLQKADHFAMENGSEKETKKPDEEWKIAPDSIKFERKLRLGVYSDVWEGLWKNCDKITIKSSNQKPTSDKFFNEAEILKSLKHLNIAALYGICDHAPEHFYIMEYMNKGSLLDLLRSEGKDYPFPTLINMCTQVAHGMAYLEMKQCIHRNLRAATVLVDENNICKVSEFELAVNLHGSSSRYFVGEGLKFAAKWTAPEAALLNQFSIKSDVWSFGILLYEVATRGKVPYPGMNNKQALEFVNKGYRMLCPPGCPANFYSTMQDCWKEDFENRPTFEYLYYQFEDSFMEHTTGYSVPL